MNGHLSDDQLLDRLYGLEQHPHADSCPDCALRYRQMELRRQELAPGVDIPQDRLISQRRRIMSRLERRPVTRWKWVPAAAAACALVAGIFVYESRPVPGVAPAPASHSESADAQLFSEMYQVEQSTEPRAAAPIHALFDQAFFEDNQ
jgi:hypothetical protein